MRVPFHTRPVRLSTLVAAGCVGIVLIVVAGVLLAHRRTLPTAFAAASTVDHPSPTAPVTTTVPARTTSPAPATVVTDPTSVRLEAFGVTAAVVPVTSGAGRLDPPDDPAQVGWWIASAPPGASTGTTVLVGHVDGPSGPGSLYRLVHAHAGDAVTVADRNGHGVTFRVTSLQYVAKADRLPATLFDQAGPPRLVVVSCGGTFDRDTDEYTDNVVVTATPERG